MKKLTAYFLTLAMLCTLMSACGGQQTQETSQPPDSSSEAASIISLPKEEKDELSRKFLSDWSVCLAKGEYFYGGMRWALSYLDPFFEDHSWESLQISRAALASARSVAETVAEKPWEVQMTAEDYDKLVRSGADVGWVNAAMDSIQSETDSVLQDYQVLQNHLNSTTDAFFLTYTLENFENWAHIQQQFYDIYLRDLAVKTDYLLSCLDSEEAEGRFLEYLAESCPQINALRKDNPQDPDALTELAEELADKMEELVSQLTSTVGQSQASLDLIQDVPQIDTEVGQESLDLHILAMADNMVDDLSGFPTVLPYPTWWMEEDHYEVNYFWDEPLYGEDRSRKFVMPNDAIVSPPNEYLVEWTDVPLEEYLAYVNGLESSYDLPSLYASEEGDVYTAFYESDPDCFAIMWEDETVSVYALEGSFCFAPYWYAYYIHRMAS